jgi:ubiquitin carboxyl-terminal hydrolase 8
MGCAVSKGAYHLDSDFADISPTGKVEPSRRHENSLELSSCNSNRGFHGHRRGLVGLKNLGNTCFLNASIQCLSNTAPLVDYFLKKNWQREINRMNPLGKSGEVAECFGDLIRQMWVGSTECSVISPDKFKKILGVYQPQFSGHEQHDAQELLAFLLDGLHEDLNRVKLKPYVEDIESDGTKDDSDVAALSWKGYLLRNRSVIVDLSQGQLRSTLRCLTCDTKSVKFDTFMYLSLPIVKKKKHTTSLRSCIREFCKAEVLKGDCQWRCSKCKEFRDAEKRLSLWTLPPILIVHLKR